MVLFLFRALGHKTEKDMDPNDGRFKTEPPTETGKEPLSERQPKPDLPDDEAESLGDFA